MRKAKTLPVYICVFVPLVILMSTQLTANIMDPCFIHYHIPHEQILFIALKQLQRTLRIVNALLFLIDLQQTHFEQSFLIFKMSAISRNFNLRLSKTSFVGFFYVF